jgi:hypothetical protein
MAKSDDYIDKALEESNADLKKLESLRKKKKKNEDALNQNIRKLILYSGFIGASISALAYLVATLVMINGVSADLTMQNQVLFSALGAVVGLLISFLLRSQGLIYAKENPEVKEIMMSYTEEKNKTKKYKQLHTIEWFMFWATVKDIFIKGISVGISTYLIVYIFIEGSGNWALFWLAISNIGLFTGFGLVSLSTIYEKYIEHHIPAVISRTNKLRAQAIENEKKLKEILNKKGEVKE